MTLRFKTEASLTYMEKGIFLRFVSHLKLHEARKITSTSLLMTICRTQCLSQAVKLQSSVGCFHFPSVDIFFPNSSPCTMQIPSKVLM